jgi:hypothetical protein
LDKNESMETEIWLDERAHTPVPNTNTPRNG